MRIILFPIAIAALLAGCYDKKSHSYIPPPSKVCIDCDESEGPSILSDKGLERYTFGMWDAHPDPDCGFDYYDNHNGGYGDTLEVIGCDAGVWMRWAYNSLSKIAVRAGWQGSTDRGIRIGDTFQQFIAAYPNTVKRPYCCPGGSICQNDDFWTSGKLLVNFDSSGLVWAMQVERFMDYDITDPPDVGWIGPSGSSPWTNCEESLVGGETHCILFLEGDKADWVIHRFPGTGPCPLCGFLIQ